MEFLIRAARVEDAEAIAEVRTRSWREAYAHLLSAEFLAALDPARGVGWLRSVIEGEASVVVAEVNGAVQGFAIAGPPTLDDPPRDLELGLIYQLPSLHGSGSGQALLDAVVADRPAYLWTAEDNPRANAFYRRTDSSPTVSASSSPTGRTSPRSGWCGSAPSRATTLSP